MPTSRQSIEDLAARRGMLRERELADRWQTSTRTLQRWRKEGYGPPFIRIGGSIRYWLADVIAYEERNRDPGAAG